jgi:hypothetical protein
MMQTRASPVVSATLVASTNRISAPKAHRARVAVRASQAVSDEGFEMMRKGVKVAAEETVLTPRYVALGRIFGRRKIYHTSLEARFARHSRHWASQDASIDPNRVRDPADGALG